MGEDVVGLLRKFWEDEVLASSMYEFMARKVRDDEKRRLFTEIAEMERRHAEVYNRLIKKITGRELRVGLRLRAKIALYKFLFFLLPPVFVIHYLELGERTTAIAYTELLKAFEDDEEKLRELKGVIYEELSHEEMLEEMIVGEKSKISRIKDAVYGITDSLVEILALVIGLAGVMSNALMVGLAGLISAIGGTFSMTSGAYLSARSQNDLYKGEVSEAEVRRKVAPELLRDELTDLLIQRGVTKETAESLVQELDDGAVKSLVIALGAENSPADPKEAASVTGKYYVLGALPAILPFFVGHLIGAPMLSIVVASIALAIAVSVSVGVLTAVLSGISIKKKAFENAGIILGATLATYSIGLLAKTLLGIEV